MADISIKGHSPILDKDTKKGEVFITLLKKVKKHVKVFGITFIKKENVEKK